MLPSLKLAVWKPLKRGQFGKGRLPSTIFRGSTWYHALQKSPPQGDLGEIARNITTNIEKPFTQRERETWLILARLHEIFEPPFFSECLALIPKFNVTGTFKNHAKKSLKIHSFWLEAEQSKRHMFGPQLSFKRMGEIDVLSIRSFLLLPFEAWRCMALCKSAGLKPRCCQTNDKMNGLVTWKGSHLKEKLVVFFSYHHFSTGFVTFRQPKKLSNKGSLF